MRSAVALEPRKIPLESGKFEKQSDPAAWTLKPFFVKKSTCFETIVSTDMSVMVLKEDRKSHISELGSRKITLKSRK